MKNKLRKIFAVLFIVITMTAFLNLKTNALSLNYSGGSTSNDTGASATTSGFTISYEEAADNVCGYRFSVVSTNGLPKSGSKVANVYLSNVTIGSTAYSSGQRFIVKSGVVANKKQLANGTKVSSTTTKQSCDYSSGSCGFYSTLPQAPSSIGSWIKASGSSYLNLQRIYVMCGADLSNATESDYVLIEPMFWVKLANVRTAATATELAIYGANVSGGDGYKGTDGNLYNAGSGTLWNLSNYINREFPNVLYVSSKTDVYAAVSVISSGKYTYKQIISNGYGCSVLTVKNVVPINQVKIAYHPNGGTVTKAGLNQYGFITIDDEAYFQIIRHGKSVDPYNATSFGLTKTGYNFKGWRVKSTGKILDQNTKYDSTVYAQHDDSSKTTANTSVVKCYLYAEWEKTAYTNAIAHWAWGFNGTGTNKEGTAYRLGTSYIGKELGEVFRYTEGDAMDIPNGYYLADKYATNSISGSWQYYSYDTDVTQNTNNMGIEYDYYLNDYNISYNLKGGTNSSNNPSTYNVLYEVTFNEPVKENAEFLGWNLKINREAIINSREHNYNYNNTLYDICSGTEYQVTIEKAELTVGSATEFTCLIYDFSAQAILDQKVVPFGEDISYIMTCPSTADNSHDIRLIIYAGIAGSTSGNAATYHNISIRFDTDGINKGADSVFSSTEALYTELAKRITGDVEVTANWYQEEKLTVVPIEPNAPYRESTEVITSYWIVNLGSADIQPNRNAFIAIDVYDGTNKVYENINQSFIVPADDKNLAYFKWRVPDNVISDKVNITCRIVLDSKTHETITEEYTVIPYTVYSTPDTQYEDKVPSSFSVPAVPESVSQYAKWWEYKYKDGKFIKIAYGLGIEDTGNAKIYSESNDKLKDSYLIKSGYPFSTAFGNLVYDVADYIFPEVLAYTYPQYINVKFPEFAYRLGDGFCRTLIYDNQWKFRANGSYGSVHFIPLYYPDGEYRVVFEKSDLWTPAGMLNAQTVSNPLVIDGDAYDDWYIGR